MAMMRFNDPFQDFDRMMSGFGGRWRGGIMPMDAFESDGLYTLRFDLPGVKPENVDVSVEGNVLTVTAERPREVTEEVTWLLRERPAGTHRREVRLGEKLDASKVHASYDNGVLTVLIPMREEAKPYKVEVSEGNIETLPAGIGS